MESCIGSTIFRFNSSESEFSHIWSSEYSKLYILRELSPDLNVSTFHSLTNFRRSWPSISLTSLSFIFSCIFVLLSHYLSFRHFSAKQSSSTHHYTRYNAYNHRRGAYGKKQDEGFLEVATFFAVCVWLVPFYRKISTPLSASSLRIDTIPVRSLLESERQRQRPPFSRRDPGSLTPNFDSSNSQFSRSTSFPVLESPHTPTFINDEIRSLLRILHRPLCPSPFVTLFEPHTRFNRRRQVEPNCRSNAKISFTYHRVPTVQFR